MYSSSIMFLYRITPTVEFTLPTYYFENQINILKNSTSLLDFIKQNYSNLQSDGSGFLVLLTGRMDYMLSPKIENNIINFELLSPPISSQPYPEKIKSYLFDREKNKFYELLLDLNNTEIDCSGSCKTEGTWSIKDVDLKNVPITKYIGVNMDNNFQIFIESGKNIQLKGDKIWWVQGDNEYKLINTNKK